MNFYLIFWWIFILFYLDGCQLAGVVAVGGGGVARTAQTSRARHGVQRLGEIGGALQHHLLRQPLGVAGVARHQLRQPAEPVVDRRLVEGCGEENTGKLIKHIHKDKMREMAHVFWWKNKK